MAKRGETAVGGDAFITFEGGDGAGKSTHIRLLAGLLEGRGYEVVVLREPGGTAIGEKLRAVVLDPENDAMDDRCELLIYEAARAQLASQVIAPALLRGAVVLCDRFTDSTVAYQGFGRGLPLDFIARANDFATAGVSPTATLLLTCGADAEERVSNRESQDRLERAGEAFRQRVDGGFLTIAEEDPSRIGLVDTAGSKADTFRQILRHLQPLFPWMGELLRGSDDEILSACAISENRDCRG